MSVSAAKDKKTIHRINAYVLRIPFRTRNAHIDEWFELFTALPGVQQAPEYYERPAEDAVYLRAMNPVQLKAAVAWLQSYLGMDYKELSTTWKDVYPKR